MSEPGDLLELMHGAAGAVASVRATLVERCRPHLLESAFRRFGEHTGFARGGGYFSAPLGGVAAGETAEEHRWEIALWADAGRFRVERNGPDLESIAVVDHDRWWQWSAAFGLRSHGDEDARGARILGGVDLLSASEIPGDGELVLAGEARVAGRRTRTVHVRGGHGSGHPHGLALGIAEATLEIDAERGLVLRRTELEGGQPAFVREVTAIAYDEPLAADRFVLELPAGASPRAQGTQRAIALDEAARLASFPVWRLAEVPPGWRIDALYAPGTERPTLPDAVTLVYERQGGGERLEIHERTPAHELPATASERCFEQGGRRFIALGPERPVGLDSAILIFAAGATQIRMASSTLSLERLCELAATLVPA